VRGVKQMKSCRGGVVRLLPEKVLLHTRYGARRIFACLQQ